MVMALMRRQWGGGQGGRENNASLAVVSHISDNDQVGQKNRFMAIVGVLIILTEDPREAEEFVLFLEVSAHHGRQYLEAGRTPELQALSFPVIPFRHPKGQC